MENQNSAQENLDYIKQVILDSKAIIKDKGDIAILWGVIIIIAQMLTFYMIRMQQYVFIGYMWGAVIAAGWILTVILVKKKDRSGVSTYALKVDSATWFSAGISMTILGFFGVYSGMLHPYGINAVIALFLGSAFFITGTIYNAKIFRNAALGWWIGGAILFWFKNDYTFIIFSILMLLFQTVPGIMLYIKYKKEEAK